MEHSQGKQFSIWQIMLWTAIVATCLALPQFAFFAPFMIGLLLLVLGIVAVVWFIAVLFESQPKRIARAAQANFVNLLLVCIGVILYAIYGYLSVGHTWSMG